MPTAGGPSIISEEGARVGFSKEICRIDFLVGGTLLLEGGYRDMPTTGGPLMILGERSEYRLLLRGISLGGSAMGSSSEVLSWVELWC
jgi:hypothetical protein